MHLSLILSLALLAETSAAAFATFQASPSFRQRAARTAMAETRLDSEAQWADDLDTRTMLFAPRDVENMYDGVADLASAFRWSALFARCHFSTHRTTAEDAEGDIALDPRTMLFLPVGERVSRDERKNEAGMVSAFRWCALFARCHWLTHRRRGEAASDPRTTLLDPRVMSLDPRTMSFLPNTATRDEIVEKEEEEVDARIAGTTVPMPTATAKYLSSLEPPKKEQPEGWERVWARAEIEDELRELEEKSKDYEKDVMEELLLSKPTEKELEIV